MEYMTILDCIPPGWSYSSTSTTRVVIYIFSRDATLLTTVLSPSVCSSLVQRLAVAVALALALLHCYTGHNCQRADKAQGVSTRGSHQIPTPIPGLAALEISVGRPLG